MNLLNKPPNADITTATTLGTLKASKRGIASTVTSANQRQNQENRQLTQFNFMKQFRFFKEDLELLIQRFRNLQKNKYSPLNDLKQFINAIEEFNKKLILLINMNSDDIRANIDFESNVNDDHPLSIQSNYKFNTSEIFKTFTKLKEYQEKINFLMEQLNFSSNSAINVINLSDTQILDTYMDQLYKIFNECLHLIEIIPNR